MYRPFYIIRDRQLAELLKIKQAGIFPQLGVHTLLAELALYLIEPWCVDKRLGPVPDFLELTDLIQALLVMIAQIIPQHTAILHFIVPREMMEP
jgi:hypothetical protein